MSFSLKLTTMVSSQAETETMLLEIMLPTILILHPCP